MPLYTYACECGFATEELHKANERRYIKCPVCGKSPLTWQFPVCNLHTDTAFLANRNDESQRGSGFWSPQLNRVVYGRKDVIDYCHETGAGSETFGISKAPGESIYEKPYTVDEDIVEENAMAVLQEKNPGKKRVRVKRKEWENLKEAERDRLQGSNK